MTIVFILIIAALLVWVCADRNTAAMLDHPSDSEGEYETLPGVQAALRAELLRRKPNAARVAHLKARIAILGDLVAKGDAHRAAWEAAHPGLDYGYFHTAP